MLLRVLVTLLRLLLVATLLVLLLNGVSLMTLTLMRFLHVCLMPPRFWTRSLVFSAAGAGLFAHQSELCWRDRRWGHVDRVQSVGVAHSCKGFVSVPGPLQTVQRAELWGVILALQSADAVHIGVDNLGVVRHVGRLLDGCSFAAPLELVTDGGLLILLRRMIDLRGCNTVRVAKVKGHADEGMVSDGRVRELDRLGNNAADEAADFGRRRVGLAVFDARRNVSGVCGRWHPVLLDLHRFLLLFLERLLIMMGLEALLLILWSWSCLVHCLRGEGLFMLFVTLLCFLGLLLSGLVSGLLVRLLLLMLLIGPTLLVFWLSGFLFLILCIGLFMVEILVWVVFLMSIYSFFLSFGLVRGYFLKRLILGIFGLASNFSVGCSFGSRH